MAISRLTKVFLTAVALFTTLSTILASLRLAGRTPYILSQLKPGPLRNPLYSQPYRGLTNSTMAPAQYQRPPQLPPKFTATKESLLADTKRLIERSRGVQDAVVKAGEATFAKAHIASYEQQLGFSNFNKELYGNGPVTRPGVKYTVIEGRYDDAVVPFTNAFLNEPGVKNILVQDTCRNDHASHVNFTYDVNV